MNRTRTCADRCISTSVRQFNAAEPNGLRKEAPIGLSSTKPLSLVRPKTSRMRLPDAAANDWGMIASGFMTEAEALDYIARYGSREHLIETERSKMKETAYRALNYGEKPRERPN
jgi:hypothetical protein